MNEINFNLKIKTRADENGVFLRGNKAMVLYNMLTVGTSFKHISPDGTVVEGVVSSKELNYKSHDKSGMIPDIDCLIEVTELSLEDFHY